VGHSTPRRLSKKRTINIGATTEIRVTKGNKKTKKKKNEFHRHSLEQRGGNHVKTHSKDAPMGAQMTGSWLGAFSRKCWTPEGSKLKKGWSTKRKKNAEGDTPVHCRPDECSGPMDRNPAHRGGSTTESVIKSPR